LRRTTILSLKKRGRSVDVEDGSPRSFGFDEDTNGEACRILSLHQSR
jgi:hypothetical protein